MIRPFLMTSVLALAAPAYADSFTSPATVDAVTVYPGLAQVTRLVTLNLPAGQHEITVPDLPKGLSADGLRLSAPQGVRLGAVNVAFDRLPVTPDLSSPEIIAAREEVARLEEVLRRKASDIAAIRLRVSAAEEQIAFLQSLSQGSAGEGLTTVTDLQSLAQMLGAEVLAVRQAAFAAEEEAKAAERARADDVEALNAAKQALAALTAPQDQGAVLTFTVDAATAGEVTIAVLTNEGFANWSPVYDMRLDTDAGALDIDRAVVISQSSGQDWQDVRLTLSTARPGEQNAPSDIWGQLRRIIPEDQVNAPPMPMLMAEGMPMQSRAFAADVAEAAPMEMVAQADFSGAAVTYVYPTRVDIRDGVEDLRLPLDTLSLEAALWAEAVPARDTVAYRVAEFTNDTAELLLPGQALLYADGTMIGFSHLPLLAAGADTEIGFGPLDGLRLSRSMPNRSQGDRGVFSTTNELTEQALIKIENLTTQSWDIRMRDGVPYSEQEDLEVTFAASPAPTRRDPEGQRGVLEWEFDIPAGATQEVTLDYTLSWPEGFVLR